MTTKSRRKSRETVRVVDIIAIYGKKLVLIERLHEPFGLALPGGHVDPGETPKQAAIRECAEETGFTFNGAEFFTERKGKRRDPRYTMSKTRVYVGRAVGAMRDEKGFTKVILVDLKKARNIPMGRFVFDHGSILKKYFEKK